MRGRSILLLIVATGAVAMGVVAFLSQRPPINASPAPYAVAKVADLSTTPQLLSVVMRRGYDRVLQRQRSSLGSCPGSMGCPGSTDVRPTPIFLLLDEGGRPHAFIGEDPRNGCALEWEVLRPDHNWFIEGVRVAAAFYDPCHGSMYDRRGRRIAGPSPWDLNQLATDIRGSDVYVDPGNILVGACPGCP